MLVPAITSCGRCGPCKAGMAAHCEAVGGIGWIFGHLIDGVQAEYARVPYAETSVHVVPEGVSDQQVLFLADILPTGYEIGVQNGGVKPGDTIAVVGAGPVGLAAMMTAADRRRRPDHRRRHRRSHGSSTPRASARRTPCSAARTPRPRSSRSPAARGVDVAMEAVGVPATFDLCTRIVPRRRHASRTSASTARRPRCTSRTSGSRTSRSPPGSSAVRRSRRCSSSPATGGSRPRSSAPTTSRSARSSEAYDVFGAAGEHDALKVVIQA